MWTIKKIPPVSQGTKEGERRNWSYWLQPSPRIYLNWWSKTATSLSGDCNILRRTLKVLHDHSQYSVCCRYGFIVVPQLSTEIFVSRLCLEAAKTSWRMDTRNTRKILFMSDYMRFCFNIQKDKYVVYFLVTFYDKRSRNERDLKRFNLNIATLSNYICSFSMRLNEKKGNNEV